MSLNPFTEKAKRARAEYERLSKPTAFETGMAESFPLGAGYGRGRVSEKRIDGSIDRAVKAEQMRKEAEHFEALALAFDQGKVNAQGRYMTKAALERSAKREKQTAVRSARIESAKLAVEGKNPWEVSAEVWADSLGYLRGSARELVISDHAAMMRRERGQS